MPQGLSEEESLESYPHISYISFSLAKKSDYKCATIIISGKN